MRVLCFGSSNTYGYDPRNYIADRYPPDARWPDLLAEKTGWEVVNMGLNGRRVPRRESDYEMFLELLAAKGPADLLLIMLGSNDIFNGMKAPRVALRMETFINLIPLEREKIVLLGQPPAQRGTWIPDDKLIIETARLNEEYAALAEKMGVRFIDGSDWGAIMCHDGTHFTEEGHRAFAEGLYRALQP